MASIKVSELCMAHHLAIQSAFGGAIADGDPGQAVQLLPVRKGNGCARQHISNNTPDQRVVRNGGSGVEEASHHVGVSRRSVRRQHYAYSSWLRGTSSACVNGYGASLASIRG